MSGSHKIIVIGATSRIGRRLLGRLQRRGATVMALGRSAQRLAGIDAPRRVVDFSDRPALADALADAHAVVSCAPLSTAPDILAALPDKLARIVFTGSTRRFSRYPDSFTEALLRAEAAFSSSGRAGIILHATMIVGEGDGNNVQRIAAFIRRFGFVALPRGGNTLVQPIYVDDVAACLESALDRATGYEPPIVIAGSESVTYRNFVEAIANAIHRRVRIIPVPALPLIAAAGMTRFLPFVPRIRALEIRRLLEDKAFDIADMRERLGVEPIGLRAMLARTFGEPASEALAESTGSRPADGDP